MTNTPDISYEACIERIGELERTLVPFTRLSVTDGQITGLDPDQMSAALATANDVLERGTLPTPSEQDA